jgi:inhibitor of cysteine peptidase
MTRMCFPVLVRMAALVGGCLMYSSSAICCTGPEKASQAMLTIVENDNGRTVGIRLSESVRIHLPENAATGYRWAIDHYDDGLIEAFSTEPQYKDNAIGSGGAVAFIFKGKKIGTGEIALKYWRHWEGDSSVIARFRIKLEVRP